MKQLSVQKLKAAPLKSASQYFSHLSKDVSVLIFQIVVGLLQSDESPFRGNLGV